MMVFFPPFNINIYLQLPERQHRAALQEICSAQIIFGREGEEQENAPSAPISISTNSQ